MIGGYTTNWRTYRGGRYSANPNDMYSIMGDKTSGAQIMNCCGAYGFAGVDNVTQDDLRGMCAFAKRARFGMAICITSHRQITAIGQLKLFGFKEVFKTYNPNSSNNIILWAFDLAEWIPPVVPKVETERRITA